MRNEKHMKLTGKESPQGTKVSWSENKDLIEGLIWTGYAPKTGEYSATLASFSVNKETKTLKLEYVSVKTLRGVWGKVQIQPSQYVTDRMKRAVRKFIAKETGTSYWRVKL